MEYGLLEISPKQNLAIVANTILDVWKENFLNPRDAMPKPQWWLDEASE